MKLIVKRLSSFVLCFVLAFSMGLNTYKAQANESKGSGEVLVMFNNKVVKDTDMSLKKARAMENVASTYGTLTKPSGETSQTAKDAASEVDIISDSLGDNFEIKDSLVFEGEKENLVVALVSSDKYDTEDMIDALEDNKKIEAVEENVEVEPEAYDDYALNDTYSSYLYNVNDPDANNTDGDSASYRGRENVTAISTNASTAWKHITGDEKEAVVAVIDTGVNYNHEDLKNKMWTNPGDIGLFGEHGFNFALNTSEIMDHIGHGTHCAGIIAAQANNNKGVAGVTGNVNIKIMGLNIFGSGDPGEDIKLYSSMGAFNYVLRAKQKGVNVVATSNSWGRDDQQSTIFDEIINKLGENGILTYIAAGNDAESIDKHTNNPCSNESLYGITVGAGDISGLPTGFSNYGEQTVDLFAPGMNTLSTVGYNCYFPDLYDDEELSRTTEYFGYFDKDTEVGESVVPETRGGDVKAFGAAKFAVQVNEYDEEAESDTTGLACDMEIDTHHKFNTDENSASLKVTIKNARYGQEYFVYFPYEKNELTTNENTGFSLFYENGANDAYHGAIVHGGEIIKDEEGNYSIVGYGAKGHDLNSNNDRIDTHCFKVYGKDCLTNYDEVEGAETGIGLWISPSKEGAPGGAWKPGDTGELELYLESVAVSRPDYEIDPDKSYEMMSGTSMACPAAAGAGALIAALNPQNDGQSGSEYATMIKNKVLSCVRKTDALDGLCQTGGYIDLSLYNESKPTINDAVCDLKNESIVISGTGLTKDCELSFSRLAVDGGETVYKVDSKLLKYSEDGKTVVIKNSKSLFGSLIQFYVKKDDKEGQNTFFLVKGQNKLEEVYREIFPNPSEEDYTGSLNRFIFTDSKGELLYGVNRETGELSTFNGSSFVPIPNTSIKKSYEKVLMGDGNSQFEIVNNYRIDLYPSSYPFYYKDTFYCPFTVTYTESADNDNAEYTSYIGTINFSENNPTWEFDAIEFPSIGDDLELDFSESSVEFMDGKMYVHWCSISDLDEDLFYNYDFNTHKWTKLPSLGTKIPNELLKEYNGKLYVMFGGVLDGDETDKDGRINDKVYCFDGSKWSQTGTLKYFGKNNGGFTSTVYDKQCARVKNGFAFIDCSVDGAGNAFVYNPEKDEITPLYYTINDGVCDECIYNTSSWVATKDGLYYMRDYSDEMRRGYALYRLPASSGAYENYYDTSDVPGPIDKVAKLDKSSLSLKAGKTNTLKVLDGTATKWFSSNSKVAKVDKNGKVIALKKGSADVYVALSNGNYLVCKVKVTSSPKLSKKKIIVKKGKTKTIKISGKALGVKNTYKNKMVAKVVSKKTAKKLKIKGLKKGKATLKIKVNGVWLVLKVKVK